ncbi:MAG: LTA synthase family protein [Cyclobacteriaceae bacterium]
MSTNSIHTKNIVEPIDQRIRLIALLTLLLVGISFATRILLTILSANEISVIQVPGIFLIGFFYDLINAGYFIIPLVVYLWVVPPRVFHKNWHRFILYSIFTCFTLILLFDAVSEFFFWDEFNARFNFIAVDYLVYTTEVLGNIKQSYPIGWIIAGLIFTTLGLVYFLKSFINASGKTTYFCKRSVWAIPILILPVLSYFLVSNKLHQFSKNMYANELAGNGMYELFSAYFNNELSYDQFYQTRAEQDSFALLKSLLKTPESDYLPGVQNSTERMITHAGEEKKLNVVLISVESLSADFMDSFGNTQHLTPFLDSLSEHSLFFTNLYATGTRTVRGLEALSLCIPPTPGQSIVRRPDNENLFSLGKVFTDKGYESKYIYGGYGYFDNMNYFFSNNNYKVVDRSSLKDEQIDYENIWGVADENLFTLAQQEIEKTMANGKPVFEHVMTTSNHRPYTYPDGRIDIPSHTSRAGAVKYTDYAIGQFIKSCSLKSWFNNTIFVIVADHCASSAGKSELPVNKYHIPLLIYSPANITRAHMDRLMSQIDIGPTLLGLLNFSYTSKFFGYDMFQLEEGRERAFVSTYQSLGFIREGELIILSPQKKVSQFTVNFTTSNSTAHSVNNQLVNEAIAWYQVSSHSFSHGLYKQ